MKKLLILLLLPIFTMSQNVYNSGQLIPTSGDVYFTNGDSLHYDIMVIDSSTVRISHTDSTMNTYEISSIDHFRYTNDSKIIYFDHNRRLRKMRINVSNDGLYEIQKGNRSLIVGASSLLVSGILFTLASNLNRGTDARYGLQVATGAVFVFGASITLDGIIKRNKHYSYVMRDEL